MSETLCNCRIRVVQRGKNAGYLGNGNATFRSPGDAMLFTSKAARGVLRDLHGKIPGETYKIVPDTSIKA